MAGFADRFAIYNDDQRRKIAEIIGRIAVSYTHLTLPTKA